MVQGYPDHLTFAPSRRRVLGRGLVEAFRIGAPHALVIAAGYAIVLDAMPLAAAGRWGAVVLDLARGQQVWLKAEVVLGQSAFQQLLPLLVGHRIFDGDHRVTDGLAHVGACRQRGQVVVSGGFGQVNGGLALEAQLDAVFP